MSKPFRFSSLQFVMCSTLFLMQAASTRAEKRHFSFAVKYSTHKTTAPHIAAASAFDTKRGRMIIFGNSASSEEARSPGLITYDPAKDEFGQIPTDGAAPSDVAYPSMVYDPKRDALYLFGGWERMAKHPTDEFWFSSELVA